MSTNRGRVRSGTEGSQLSWEGRYKSDGVDQVSKGFRRSNLTYLYFTFQGLEHGVGATESCRQQLDMDQKQIWQLQLGRIEEPGERMEDGNYKKAAPIIQGKHPEGCSMLCFLEQNPYLSLMLSPSFSL